MTQSLIPKDLKADMGPSLRGTTTALLVLATLFTGLRFWARYAVRASFGSDDWSVVGALVSVFVAGAINYAMISYGLGRHAATLPQEDLVSFFKLLLAFECVYVTAVMMVKLAVLAMYLRIFPSREFRIGAAIIASIVIAWWIAIVAVCIWQCDPIKKAWLPWIEGTCINLKASFIGNAIPNILTDVAILAMPVGQVWKLQITVAQKASLLFIFLLGSFVLFASIYRFTTLMQFDISDTTFTLATSCTWCVVEVSCAVISACLPTLRPLMSKISSQFGSLKGRSRPSENNSSRVTELATIGGTRGQRSQRSKLDHFQRLEHDPYGVSAVITSSQSTERINNNDKSSAETMSRWQSGIRVAITHEVHRPEGTVTGSSHGQDAGYPQSSHDVL
ncbi:hypothetical protein ACJ41O_007575 [Fusarium nematophilum]